MAVARAPARVRGLRRQHPPAPELVGRRRAGGRGRRWSRIASPAHLGRPPWLGRGWGHLPPDGVDADEAELARLETLSEGEGGGGALPVAAAAAAAAALPAAAHRLRGFLGQGDVGVGGDGEGQAVRAAVGFEGGALGRGGGLGRGAAGRGQGGRAALRGGRALAPAGRLGRRGRRVQGQDAGLDRVRGPGLAHVGRRGRRVNGACLLSLLHAGGFFGGRPAGRFGGQAAGGRRAFGGGGRHRLDLRRRLIASSCLGGQGIAQAAGGRDGKGRGAVVLN